MRPPVPTTKPLPLPHPSTHLVRRQLSSPNSHAYADDTSADRPSWRPSHQQQHLTTSTICHPLIHTHNTFVLKTSTRRNQQVRNPRPLTTPAQHHNHHQHRLLSNLAKQRSGSHGDRSYRSPRQVYRRGSEPRRTMRRSSAALNALSGIVRLRTTLVSASDKRQRVLPSPLRAPTRSSRHTRSSTVHCRATLFSPRFKCRVIVLKQAHPLLH